MEYLKPLESLRQSATVITVQWIFLKLIRLRVIIFIYQRRGGRGGDIYIGTDSLSPDIKLFVILIKINLCQIDIFFSILILNCLFFNPPGSKLFVNWSYPTPEPLRGITKLTFYNF